MSECRVQRLTQAHEQQYQVFVEQHHDAMLYHSLPYLKLIAGLTGGESETLLAFDESGRLVGVLPALSKDGPHGRIVNSLPYYGSNGGPLALTPAAEAALVAAYNRLATSAGVGSATLIGNPVAASQSRTAVAHTLTDYRIGQFTNLAHQSRHADALMDSFHHKTRNTVRKGQKSGLTVRVENDMVDFLRDVHQENLRAMGGLPKSAAFFEGFPLRFQADRDFRIWVARDGSEPVAALLLFYFRGTVEYFTPVIREAYRASQPLSLLIFHAMVEASERGFALWNWGGTWATQDGLYLFKARWGTRDVNYSYYVQLNDETIYSAVPEFLLHHYANFFVVPFHRLRTAS